MKTLLSLIISLILPACLFAQEDLEKLETEEFGIEQQAQPKIVIRNNVYNFGTVNEGAKVEHNFEITNTGKDNLIIQRVVPTCGCTAAAPSVESIAPGSSATIKVTFSSSGFTGNIEKTIRVFTNDPNQMATALTLKGTVLAEISISPYYLDFGDIVLIDDVIPTVASREVVVKLRDNIKNTKLENPVLDSTLFEISDIEGSDYTKKFKVSTILTKDTAPGEVINRILFLTSGAQKIEKSLNVRAVIKGPIQITPAEVISFGIIEGTNKIKRVLEFTNLASTPVTISSIKSGDRALNVNYNEIEQGKRYSIEVELDPTRVDKELRTVITIRTKGLGDKDYTITANGIVPPKKITN